MNTFDVRTFGCQMNKHDSERIAGLLLAMGLSHAPEGTAPDVVVFNTCCVRENADGRLYGQVASVKALKLANPETLIAVGGCVGQRDGAAIVAGLPHVDVVFGTHNIGSLPALLNAAAESRRPVVEVSDSSDGDFASDLPTEREHAWHAWVPITVGCDNFCTYCVVPYVRGRERSRTLDDVVTEIGRLITDGVVEVTLLGQNVNSYGRDLYGEPRFAELLTAVAGTGIDRIRFTTSHPKDLSDATIEAMATHPNIARYLHLPVQSGSDDVLKRMNRHYTQEAYLALVARLYAAMPDLALSTDVIVGFPGETESDFEKTMQVVEAARYDQAFTFIYSPREGTPAATMDDQIPREVAQPRFDRLVSAIQASALAKSQAYVGTVQRVLVEGPSKRDAGVLAGRTSGNKMVHAVCPEGVTPTSLAGTFTDVEITDAQTWFLVGSVIT
ncbi:MAG: tRNA (N6-isopentenyl adenosine(37)-C2)-methylthiotransferase MiaB [Coriobacteriia bacterium]|nr:tRNA (N6-isopentenyl adenosine(37)-C2)-methylthiotransferase MiaB [Coriobacteriia bacterium]